ncbi:MAG: HAD hydrolase family protein, partial [Veillonella sp.]|nr:HAD hydrolase family protein [Veillonella sp.]
EIEHMTHKLIRYGDGCVLYEPMEKALGIRNMLDHFGMKPNQAVVFGDGYNDLSMFRPEWLNIAMGNARAELKEKADYITTDCDKDGIYNACKHFKWID